jgi:uncharacterized protein YndB with AHSA1/START domain
LAQDGRKVRNSGAFAADRIAARMGPISLDISIDAPRERVFDYVCDLGRRPAWAQFAHDYRLERLEASGEGAAARFRVGARGGVEYMETVIASAERPHTIVERGRGGHLDRVRIQTVWELTGGEGEGDITDLTLTFATDSPAAFDRMREFGAGRWWRRRWSRALRNLRAQLESDAPPPEPVGVAGGDRQPIDSRVS